ncbi:hypothetical protein CR513_01785, partial [Mucuna pruriens]
DAFADLLASPSSRFLVGNFVRPSLIRVELVVLVWTESEQPLSRLAQSKSSLTVVQVYLVGEDPHKHLKEFHVVYSTMRPYGILISTTQSVNSVELSSMTIAMDDSDGSPLLAKALRIKSTRVQWQAKRFSLRTFDLLVHDLRFFDREKHQ